MPTQFPNAQDCEQLAYAPESIRFCVFEPFIPDPFWYRARWFEDRARPRRLPGRTYHRLVIAGLCAALLAGGSLAFSRHGVAVAGATPGQHAAGAVPHNSGPSGIGIG